MRAWTTRTMSWTCTGQRHSSSKNVVGFWGARGGGVVQGEGLQARRATPAPLDAQPPPQPPTHLLCQHPINELEEQRALHWRQRRRGAADDGRAQQHVLWPARRHHALRFELLAPIPVHRLGRVVLAPAAAASVVHLSRERGNKWLEAPEGCQSSRACDRLARGNHNAALPNLVGGQVDQQRRRSALGIPASCCFCYCC